MTGEGSFWIDFISLREQSDKFDSLNAKLQELGETARSIVDQFNQDDELMSNLYTSGMHNIQNIQELSTTIKNFKVTLNDICVIHHDTEDAIFLSMEEFNSILDHPNIVGDGDRFNPPQFDYKVIDPPIVGPEGKMKDTYEELIDPPIDPYVYEKPKKPVWSFPGYDDADKPSYKPPFIYIPIPDNWYPIIFPIILPGTLINGNYKNYVYDEKQYVYSGNKKDTSYNKKDTNYKKYIYDENQNGYSGNKKDTSGKKYVYDENQNGYSDNKKDTDDKKYAYDENQNGYSGNKKDSSDKYSDSSNIDLDFAHNYNNMNTATERPNKLWQILSNYFPTIDSSLPWPKSIISPIPIGTYVGLVMPILFEGKYGGLSWDSFQSFISNFGFDKSDNKSSTSDSKETTPTELTKDNKTNSDSSTDTDKKTENITEKNSESDIQNNGSVASQGEDATYDSAYQNGESAISRDKSIISGDAYQNNSPFVSQPESIFSNNGEVLSGYSSAIAGGLGGLATASQYPTSTYVPLDWKNSLEEITKKNNHITDDRNSVIEENDSKTAFGLGKDAVFSSTLNDGLFGAKRNQKVPAIDSIEDNLSGTKDSDFENNENPKNSSSDYSTGYYQSNTGVDDQNNKNVGRKKDAGLNGEIDLESELVSMALEETAVTEEVVDINAQSSIKDDGLLFDEAVSFTEQTDTESQASTEEAISETDNNNVIGSSELGGTISKVAAPIGAAFATVSTVVGQTLSHNIGLSGGNELSSKDEAKQDAKLVNALSKPSVFAGDIHSAFRILSCLMTIVFSGSSIKSGIKAKKSLHNEFFRTGDGVSAIVSGGPIQETI